MITYMLLTGGKLRTDSFVRFIRARMYQIDDSSNLEIRDYTVRCRRNTTAAERYTRIQIAVH